MSLIYRGDTIRIPAFYERVPLEDEDHDGPSAYPARIAGILSILGLRLAADWSSTLRSGDGYCELPVVPIAGTSLDDGPPAAAPPAEGEWLGGFRRVVLHTVPRSR